MADAAQTRSGQNIRQVYLEAALKVINAEGVAGLTMRRVATHLGVTPMAVYKHFANKEDLLAACLDEFIARSDVFPPDELPWDEWMLYMARGMYQALSGQVSWVPALGAARTGEQALIVTRSFVDKLSAAGFSARDTAYAYSTMTQLVVGSVANRSTVEKETENRDEAAGNYLHQLMTEDGTISRDITEAFSRLSLLPQIEIGMPLLIEALQQRLAKGDPKGMGTDHN